LHVVKHQENKFKILLKRKINSWEIAKAQHMCALAKVDAFWKKYWPRAPINKISVVMLLESFCRLVDQSPPSIWLRINHLTQVTEFPPSHTLNIDITLVVATLTLGSRLKQGDCKVVG
jgi:hypothetical protein